MIVNPKQMSKRGAPVPAHVLAIAEAKREELAARVAVSMEHKEELYQQTLVLAPTILEPVMRKRGKRKGRNRMRQQ